MKTMGYIEAGVMGLLTVCLAGIAVNAAMNGRPGLGLIFGVMACGALWMTARIVKETEDRR